MYGLTEHLQQCIDSEKNSTDFVPMPPHFLEVAAIIFEWWVIQPSGPSDDADSFWWCCAVDDDNDYDNDDQADDINAGAALMMNL